MSKRNILIIVDYQKDFVDGALGFESAKNLDAGIRNLAQKYIEDESGMVICTFDAHSDNYLDTQEGRKLPVAHCIYESDGFKLYGKTGEYIYSLYEGVAPLMGGSWLNTIIEVSDELPEDKLYLAHKPTFGSMRLGNFLESIVAAGNEVETITLVGVVTNMCVISNAVIAKAACPEAEIIIKKDLVDSFDKKLHAQALELMTSMQMTVE